MSIHSAWQQSNINYKKIIIMQTIEEFQKFETPLTHVQAPRIGRVHIGLVQLSTDHSLEMDWAKLLGTQAGVFSSRVITAVK